MVELRKRKAPAPPPVEKKAKSAKPATKPTPKPAAPKQDAPSVDDVLDLAQFGGEFETNEGHKTSLQKLVEESDAGVVLFTYPKASTPGCK